MKTNFEERKEIESKFNSMIIQLENLKKQNQICNGSYIDLIENILNDVINLHDLYVENINHYMLYNNYNEVKAKYLFYLKLIFNKVECLLPICNITIENIIADLSSLICYFSDDKFNISEYNDNKWQCVKSQSLDINFIANELDDCRCVQHTKKNLDKSSSKNVNDINEEASEHDYDSNCYLTTACMMHYLNNFDDHCYELEVLRWFRDSFVSKEDINYYYLVAPMIINEINNEDCSRIVYDYIYDNVIEYCVGQIEKGNYKEAYDRYKKSVLMLENTYIKSKKKENKS